MLHFDGQSPSGFEWSSYRVENTRWTPDIANIRIKNIVDMIRFAQNTTDFWDLFEFYWETLFWPFG